MGLVKVKCVNVKSRFYDYKIMKNIFQIQSYYYIIFYFVEYRCFLKQSVAPLL